ncbi:MAG: carbon starvation CstA family protein [Fibrobacterota bacterium]
MNSVVVLCAALVVLFLGYRFYSPLIRKWITVDDDMITPAHTQYDGDDYVPAKHWTVLFGHHFSSIAGAAPIIGPVAACALWGWLPAVIWLLVGGILFGAVHDYTSLIISIKNQGQSITAITESIMGRSSRILFSLFAFLALILVVAVFAAVAGKTLTTTPELVVPTFGLIPVAMLTGWLIYTVQFPLIPVTLLGTAMLVGLIVLGYAVPVNLPVEHAENWWIIILLIYGLIASVTPVTLILQPRDHLSGAVLFFGLFFGILGVLITRPEINAPLTTGMSSSAGFLWPMLFVTVACGAISGFHSLIASGTTSKQLPRVRDARPIGFGSMLIETLLSILAVLCVTAGLTWDFGPVEFRFLQLMEEGGPLLAFGTGYGELTRPIFGSLGMLIGTTILNIFVMTTLDSATRITRYIGSDLFGDTFNIPPFKNKYIMTAAIGCAAGLLAVGNWQAIWPVFGASNQLIASLVLIVATTWLVKRNRPALFTALPALFMLITTLAALIYQMTVFLGGDEKKYLLAATAGILIILALILSVLSAQQIKKAFEKRAEGEYVHG